MLRPLLRFVTTGIGFALIATAILAPQLGLDTNADWGPSRQLLLLGGVLVIVAAWATRWAPPLKSFGLAVFGGGSSLVGRAAEAAGLRLWMERVGKWWSSSRLALALARAGGRMRALWGRLLARSQFLSALLGTRRARVLTACWSAFLVVAVSYLWFVSVGMWWRWPDTSAYYDKQAEAFLRGQAHLVEEPSQALLDLPDPYDTEARASVPYLWDASLYGDRYYLYWGPVPALLIAPIKAMTGGSIGDNVLVFLFSLGSLFWTTRLITRLWADFYEEIPAWVVVGSVFTVGWANPTPWLLNAPWVYEAAIVGGQFFLLMGVNSLYPLLARGTGRATDLAWAGASFAMAVGTRAGTAVATGVVTSIVLARLLARRGPVQPGGRALLAAAFVLPLAVGTLSLARYNQIRFDSPFEFGHRYQLTSLNFAGGDLESVGVRNIPPNLYNYLVNPVRFLRVFPYFKAHWGGVGMSVLRIPVPPGYYSRQVAGVAIVAPFLLFAVSAVWRLWKGRRRSAPADDAGSSADRAAWLTVALLGVGGAQLLIVGSYIVAAMRYQADFMPALMLVATIGLWGILADRIRHRRSIAGYRLAALALMSWTVIAGLLLGVTSYYARFEKLNPELFHWMTDAFTL